MTGAHTPTPWGISYGFNLGDGKRAVYVAGPDPKQIGIKLMTPWIESAWDGDTEAEANAEFIVRAANCHDDLVKCAIILANLQADDGGRMFPTKDDCAFARATLAAAQPKEINP